MTYKTPVVTSGISVIAGYFPWVGDDVIRGEQKETVRYGVIYSKPAKTRPGEPSIIPLFFFFFFFSQEVFQFDAIISSQIPYRKVVELGI